MFITIKMIIALIFLQTFSWLSHFSNSLYIFCHIFLFFSFATYKYPQSWVVKWNMKEKSIDDCNIILDIQIQNTNKKKKRIKPTMSISNWKLFSKYSICYCFLFFHATVKTSGRWFIRLYACKLSCRAAKRDC